MLRFACIIALDLALNFAFVLIEEFRQRHRPGVMYRWITAQVLLIAAEARPAGGAARAAIKLVLRRESLWPKTNVAGVTGSH